MLDLHCCSNGTQHLTGDDAGRAVNGQHMKHNQQIGDRQRVKMVALRKDGFAHSS